MTSIQLLAAVPRAIASLYYGALTQYDLTLLSDSRDALEALEDRSRHFDALVLDANLPDADTLLADIQYNWPRMMVILVDESGVSALRNQVAADRISTTPFVDEDLDRRILRLLSDSQLETMPANTMLPVRKLARMLRAEEAPGERFQIAVEACQTLGYRYTAFYRVDQQEPMVLKLAAQQGEDMIRLLVPLSASNNDLIAEVARSGQSRIVTASDAADYLPVAVGDLGSAALVPAGRAVCFGVLVAGREAAGSIGEQNVTVLELVAAQLAAALTRELGT